MRKVEQQIARVRRETENEDVSDSIGVSDEEFIGYLNDAQDRVYSEVVKKHPKFFLQEQISSVAANTEALALPTKIYLGQLTLVEFSRSGLPKDYRRIKQSTMVERLSFPIGEPEYYIRRNKELLWVPTPGVTGGFARMTYVEKLPTLDKRRGQISTVTLSSESVTSLVLTTGTFSDDDRQTILDDGFLCVVAATGEQKMASIPVEDIDTSTGVVTLGSGFTFDTGETAAAGDYVVSGEFATNKSELLDITERYLISHLRMEILDRDSHSEGTASQTLKMEKLLGEIVGSFADVSDDVMDVPVLDSQYFLDNNFY